MSNHTRELLNHLYQPLEKRAHEFTAMLAGLHGGFKISSGFFNRHYHKNAAGVYQADAYPIPVISVMGLCDIEIDIDSITLSTKFSKEQIAAFDWNSLGDIRFEVYGVEEYLCDYGNEKDTDGIKNRALSSAEKEFFVSFFLSTAVTGEDLKRAVEMLQKKHFYY